MNIRRIEFLEVSEGGLFSYIHNSTAEGLGRLGVLVSLESKLNVDELATLGKQIAMHVAATSPKSLSIDDLDEKIVNKELEIIFCDLDLISSWFFIIDCFIFSASWFEVLALTKSFCILVSLEFKIDFILGVIKYFIKIKPIIRETIDQNIRDGYVLRSNWGSPVFASEAIATLTFIIAIEVKNNFIKYNIY